jgi:FixJ family two-component response regulator
MPGLSGLEVQEQLAARGCGMPVLFLTGRGEVPTSVRAMKNGAQDFLSKPVDGPALIAAVREALARDLTGHEAAIELAAFRARMATLTPREHEVLGEVLTGKLNKQIAAVLGTAEKTVKVHRARVMDKLGIDSVAELARLAERAGLNG